MTRTRLAMSTAFVAAVVSSCAGPTPPAAETRAAMVEGTVTFHGRPLAGGTVTFIPAPGSENKLEPGIARIESDGSYWIGNANLSKPAGLVPGKYKVTVLKMRTDPNGIRMQTPAIYADSRTTPWEFAVEAGRNRIRLDIEEPVTAPESDDSKVAAQFNDERK